MIDLIAAAEREPVRLAGLSAAGARAAYVLRLKRWRVPEIRCWLGDHGVVVTVGELYAALRSEKKRSMKAAAASLQRPLFDCAEASQTTGISLERECQSLPPERSRASSEDAYCPPAAERKTRKKNQGNFAEKRESQGGGVVPCAVGTP